MAIALCGGREEHTEEVEDVLKHEEKEHLRDDLLPCREGHLPCRHAEHLRHGVEQPNLKKLLVGMRVDARVTRVRTTGSSTVKWERRTSLAQDHCSAAVGIFSMIVRSAPAA